MRRRVFGQFIAQLSDWQGILFLRQLVRRAAFYSHFRNRLMYSALLVPPDLRSNQSAGFLWLKSGKLPFPFKAVWFTSPEKRILPDSMASLNWTREAISKPHLFLGPSNRQVSVVSQSIPLCGRGDGAMGQRIALRQFFPNTSNRFCLKPKL